MSTTNSPNSVPWRGVPGFSPIEVIRSQDGRDLALIQSASKSEILLMLSAPELMQELHKAHLIIRNALNLMTVDQKIDWARLNEIAGVTGEGVTRANERESVLKKATP